MNDKLLIVDGNTAEIRKLLLKLFTAEAESTESIPADNIAFVCVGSERSETGEQLKKLGYKIVTVAYTDELINKTIGNRDLEKHGYKFEDGV